MSENIDKLLTSIAFDSFLFTNQTTIFITALTTVKHNVVGVFVLISVFFLFHYKLLVFCFS